MSFNETTLSFAIFTIDVSEGPKLIYFVLQATLSLMALPVKRGATQDNWEKVIKGMVENFEKETPNCPAIKALAVFKETINPFLN